MAYTQDPGRGDKPKTGANVEGITGTIAGSSNFHTNNPNAFKSDVAPTIKLQTPNLANNFTANQSAQAKATPFERASYDMAVKGGYAKTDTTASRAYGKGSAKAGDTSAETMILKQNENQLPGGKGFKGGTNERGTTIFPDVKGNAKTGFIPKENQTSGETYAGNTSKTYYTSETKGNLGKLQTLATGQTGMDYGGVGQKSRSTIGESFARTDEFNQQMGGKMNPTKIGRDVTYGTSIGEDKRANTFTGAAGDNSGLQKHINVLTAADASSNFGKQEIYNNPQGKQALKSGDTAQLMNMAKQAGIGAGQKGEIASNYLQANINAATPKGPNAGYESTYKQKYDYPTDTQYTKGAGRTYTGPKSGVGYFSPGSTLAQNKAAAGAADQNQTLSQYLTKGKSRF